MNENILQIIFSADDTNVSQLKNILDLHIKTADPELLLRDFINLYIDNSITMHKPDFIDHIVAPTNDRLSITLKSGIVLKYDMSNKNLFGNPDIPGLKDMTTYIIGSVLLLSYDMMMGKKSKSDYDQPMEPFKQLKDESHFPESSNGAIEAIKKLAHIAERIGYDCDIKMVKNSNVSTLKLSTIFENWSNYDELNVLVDTEYIDGDAVSHIIESNIEDIPHVYILNYNGDITDLTVEGIYLIFKFVKRVGQESQQMSIPY